MWLLWTALTAASDDDLVRALSVRHDPPPCADLEAEMVDPAATWARLAERTPGPPWVAIRAARCLLARPADATPAARRWFADPALAGLADQALAVLPTLPDGRALLDDALAGPHAARATRRLTTDPALRALAAQ